MGWKHAALIAALVAACGGGSAIRHGTEPDRLVADETHEARVRASEQLIAAFSTHDATAIQAVMSDDVTYGGLWFPDSECRRTLGGSRSIRGDEIATLARCLAPLSLVLSENEHPYPNVGVFTYDPGIEIEVLFDLASSKVKWIGYAGRRNKDVLPSVTATALLALRSEASSVKLDPSVVATLTQEHDRFRPTESSQPHFYAWLKICIDATGAVTGAHPYEVSSLKARDAFVAMAKAWSFQPFVLGDQPTPVCALIDLEEPDPPKDRPALPFPTPAAHPDAPYVPWWTLGPLIAGTKLLVPDDHDKTAINHAGLAKMVSSVNYCVAADGTVDSVQLVTRTPFLHYNASLVNGVGNWRFNPQPEPVCSTATFVYSQR